MKILRYVSDDRVSWGLLEGDSVRELDAPPFGVLATTDRVRRLAEVTLLPPVVPSKIVCLGLNYRDHAAEFGNPVPEVPVLFMKPPSAVIGPGDPIRLPRGAGRVDYEAELALVVGRRCRDLAREEAAGALLGVTCLNDVTAREQQRRDGQWTRAKGYDTFCPLGPWIETGEPLAARQVSCRLDGRAVQSGATADLVFDIPSILAFVSGIMTLEPGDVIATGTPPGVGPLAPGDRVEVSVSGVGTLSNPVE
jgi:2-keto-4-pentenoate hydratase/2-oxohepta-3-ene-1,7-dioic acid hydratase in catechol pathway